MIAKVAFFCAALAACRATGLLAPAVYGHGLAIKAPAAPVLAAPLLTKTFVAAPVAVHKSSVITHHAAPLHYAKAYAPLPYAKAIAPVAYTTTITKTAPLAPVLSHTGFLGAAPLAYTGLLGHGFAGHGYGLAGHGLAGHGLLAHGPALAYAPGHHGVYAPAVLNHGKVLL